MKVGLKLGRKCIKCGKDDWEKTWYTKSLYKIKHDKKSGKVIKRIDVKRCKPCHRARDARYRGIDDCRPQFQKHRGVNPKSR